MAEKKPAMLVERTDGNEADLTQLKRVTREPDGAEHTSMMGSSESIISDVKESDSCSNPKRNPKRIFLYDVLKTEKLRNGAIKFTFDGSVVNLDENPVAYVENCEILEMWLQ